MHVLFGLENNGSKFSDIHLLYEAFWSFSGEKTQIQEELLASLLFTWGPLLQCCSKQRCAPQRLNICRRFLEIILRGGACNLPTNRKCFLWLVVMVAEDPQAKYSSNTAIGFNKFSFHIWSYIRIASGKRRYHQCAMNRYLSV